MISKQLYEAYLNDVAVLTMGEDSLESLRGRAARGASTRKCLNAAINTLNDERRRLEREVWAYEAEARERVLG